MATAACRGKCSDVGGMAMYLQPRLGRAPRRLPEYTSSDREGARARPDGPARRVTSYTPSASATSPAYSLTPGAGRGLHAARPGRIPAPPDCCASSSDSTSIADRRPHASRGRLRRLPALSSRCGARSPVSSTPGSPDDARPSAVRPSSHPSQRASRARRPTGMQLKASQSGKHRTLSV